MIAHNSIYNRRILPNATWTMKRGNVNMAGKLEDLSKGTARVQAATRQLLTDIDQTERG